MVEGATFLQPLEKLLFAVRVLLMGASEAKCSWLEEPGEYRWLLSRKGEHLQIQIRWVSAFGRHPDYAGEMIPPYFPINEGRTILQMECDLLKFAKRLSHQVGQIHFQGRVRAGEHEEDIHDVEPAAPLGSLREAISAYEQAKREKHGS